MDRYLVCGLIGGVVIGLPLAFGVYFLTLVVFGSVPSPIPVLMGMAGAWAGCEIGARLWGDA